MRAGPSRRGLSAVEIIVASVFVLIATACLLIAIPRAREGSRRATCQRNLMQIGMALSLYHQSAGRLPTAGLDGDSPITAMLTTLGQADFAAFRDPKVAPPRRSVGPIAERTILGLLCPTDRDAFAGTFPAPVSYRSNTGDTADGRGGPFAIGLTVTLAEVEAGDGASYTASFAERLVGDGRNGAPAPSAYARVPGPIGESGCPESPDSSWWGDAGSSWLRADWRSTLYGHLPPPGAGSCIAEDGRTAFLGASSAHREGVHVLLLDGSLRTYLPSVAPGVWRGLGTIGEPGR